MCRSETILLEVALPMSMRIAILTPFKRLLAAAGLLALALPLANMAWSEEAMIWAEKSSGTSTSLAYQSISLSNGPPTHPHRDFLGQGPVPGRG